MTINLTPEQESRLQSIMSRGAYASVEEVVEAALVAVEQRTLRGLRGRPENLMPCLRKDWHRKSSRRLNFGVR